MASAFPKAALYYATTSVWSAAVILALEEKGYGPDEVDLRPVDLDKGENFPPSFLRLNPQATVPTLVVPLQKTVGVDIESRYRAIKDTKSIIDFLDKSRSVTSHTRTTSSAPAPSLTPATISFAEKSAHIIEILHSNLADPNTLHDLNARNLPALGILVKERLHRIQGRSDALAELLVQADREEIHVSEKTKNFWKEKKSSVDALLEVYQDAGKDAAQLDVEAAKKREAFFANAKEAWEVNLKEVLIKLNGEIMGLFVLGDQLSLGDLHLAAWLVRLVQLAGGNDSHDGSTAMNLLRTHVGLPKELSAKRTEQVAVVVKQSTAKLVLFWDVMKKRPSWNAAFVRWFKLKEDGGD